MKITVLAATALLMTATSLFAADQTWTGTISDKMCGADHKAMGATSARDCTLACTKDGTPFAFVVNGKVYQLSGHEADLKTHAGHTVQLTGELKGDTIKVSGIDMPKPGK